MDKPLLTIEQINGLMRLSAALKGSCELRDWWRDDNHQTIVASIRTPYTPSPMIRHGSDDGCYLYHWNPGSGWAL